MDPIEQSLRNQIVAMTRVLAMVKIFREENYPSTIKEAALKDLNITHILNVTSCLEASHPNNFVYKVINGYKSKEYFEECFEFIDEGKRAGGCVFVYRFVGRSRSVTIVVAYLMKKYRMTMSQALEYVRSRGSRASPNASLIIQLQECEICVTET
ncbi:hypothetical protein UlMin_002003 [Ulmus minor]